MATLRVLAGDYKGRVIPFTGEGAPGADVTTQKVKKAFFDIMGARTLDARFLDLYAGSGQIAVEALSRGAAFAVANELDRQRAEGIKNFMVSLGVGSRGAVTSLAAETALERYRGEGRFFDIIFLDPPYVKQRGHAAEYDTLLDRVGESCLLPAGGVVVVQHFSANELSDERGGLVLFDQRRYGSSTLSFYDRRESS